MKKILFLFSIISILFISCDKVDNAYLPGVGGTINWDLYPNGDSTDYVTNSQWPTFSANANTNRNILIEDFTGHKCTFCPLAAVEAESIEAANPGRVFATAMHTGPAGDPNDPFQAVSAPDFTHNFTFAEVLEIGAYFGANWPSSNFLGNPKGTISRIDDGTGQVASSPGNWASITNAALAANDLKVNIQAGTNFYPSTNGFFLHTEVEILDAALTNELSIVVLIVEDSIVKPQKMSDNSVNHNYVHRNVMRDCIDGYAFGQTLDSDHLDANGKYYFDYSYELSTDYNADNMHVLIYVRDAVTEEIYQVIEHHMH